MRILMPIDGTSSSNSAVDFVASRTTLLKKPIEVELVNIQPPVPVRVARAVGKEMVKEHHAREAGQVLKGPEAKLSRAGANARSYYLVGTINEDLVEVVRGDPADLIVIGSQGDSGLAHLLFGSVAETVASSCTKPLLILRGDPAPKRDNLKVALALDGSKYGLAAARFLAQHAALLGAKPAVTLVHVSPELTTLKLHGWMEREVKTGILPEQAQVMHKASFEAAFAPVHEILKSAGIQAKEARLLGDDPGLQIAAYAAKNTPDLLAMGSLGFGANRFAPMGSVASRVASRVRTPLLLVREA